MAAWLQPSRRKAEWSSLVVMATGHLPLQRGGRGIRAGEESHAAAGGIPTETRASPGGSGAACPWNADGRGRGNLPPRRCSWLLPGKGSAFSAGTPHRLPLSPGRRLRWGGEGLPPQSPPKRKRGAAGGGSPSSSLRPRNRVTRKQSSGGGPHPRCKPASLLGGVPGGGAAWPSAGPGGGRSGWGGPCLAGADPAPGTEDLGENRQLRVKRAFVGRRAGVGRGGEPRRGSRRPGLQFQHAAPPPTHTPRAAAPVRPEAAGRGAFLQGRLDGCGGEVTSNRPPPFLFPRTPAGSLLQIRAARLGFLPAGARGGQEGRRRQPLFRKDGTTG